MDANPRPHTRALPATAPPATDPPNTAIRGFLLALILAAFARLTWELGAKSLWWDESLTLQRAEQGWLPLLLGHLVMFDGRASQLTIDQHPFFYFLLQGLFIRLAGTSEYALRFVAVMAATLFVPALWAWSRALARRAALPPSTPVFAALLASVSPFMLWFGQEARPYTLWALLAVISTYWLLRVALPQATTEPGRAAWIAYAGSTLAFLATHYYAVFLLPLHALAWFIRLYGRRPRVALGVAVGLLLGGATLAGLAYYRIIVLQGGGANFARIRLGVLIPDLLNAYSLGLSVNIDQVWWLDLVYGAVAVAGLIWLLARPHRLMTRAGWLPVLSVAVPVLAVLALNWFIPAYMTARHLSLIAGGWLLLVGAGLGALWQVRNLLRLAALPLALLLVAGAAYSTQNYFTDPEYDTNDFPAVGRHLANHVADGDLILLNPPFSWRIFDYYLPLDALDQAAQQGAHVQTAGVPRLATSWDARDTELAELTAQYRRIWYVVLGTHPFLDPEGRTESWLDENLFRLNTRQFFSHSELTVTQYAPAVPVTWETPAFPRATSVTFGDQIRLASYSVGETLYPNLGQPVTLYWQTLAETDRRYKYGLRLVRLEETDSAAAPAITEVAARTEREPYDGAIPTIYWAPGQTIIEDSELIAPGGWDAIRAAPAAYRLALEVYDAETLEKLPVTATTGAAIANPDTREFAFLPYVLE